MTYLQTYHIREEDIQKTWDLKRLWGITDEIAHDHGELNALYEMVQSQLGVVRETTFTWHVELMRRGGYSGQKIEYYVTAFQTPDIEDGKRFHIYPNPTDTDSKRFTGKERKKALEYAWGLAKKYGCEIEGNVEVEA